MELSFLRIKMKYFALFLLFLSININAQLDFFYSSYLLADKKFYALNEGILYADPEEGDYQLALKHINSNDFKNDSESKLLLSTLLDYNTKGKTATFSELDSKPLTKEEKEFVKVWVSYYANALESDVLAKNFEEKYPNNVEYIKFWISKKTKLKSRLFYNSNGDELKVIDRGISLVTNNEDDLRFFQLAKLDFVNDRIGQKSLENFDQLYQLWKLNPDKFSYKGMMKFRIGDCNDEKCNAINKWITKEEKSNTSPKSTEYQLVLLLLENREKLQLPLPELENEINALIASSKNEETKAQLKSIVNIYALPKSPSLGMMMDGLIKPIPFSNEFRTKNKLNYSKDQTITFLKNLISSQKINFRTQDINEKDVLSEIESYKKYSLEDVHALFGVSAFTFYYKDIFNDAFKNLGKVPKSEIKNDQASSYKEYLKFYEENLFHDYNEELGIDFEDLKTYEDLQNFMRICENLIAKFPGTIVLREMYLDKLYKYKALVPKDRFQEFQYHYFTYWVNLINDFPSANETSYKRNFQNDNAEKSLFVNLIKVQSCEFQTLEIS